MNVVPKTPLSSVKVLRGVPLNSSNTDTMKFSNLASQENYFSSKTKQTFTELTTLDLTNGVRLPCGADFLYDCNYIMFQNLNFGSKWFYAFIKRVEYKSFNMCILYFEIDDLQTWQFEWELRQSLVIREHSRTDNVGDSLTTENVDLGYYVDDTAVRTNKTREQCVVVATSIGSTGNIGALKGGVYSGLTYVPFPVSADGTVPDIEKFLTDITTANKSDSIVSIFQMPTNFVVSNDQTTPPMYRVEVPRKTTSLGSYTPRNKKLLTYPYNYLYVFTPQGSNASYRYELFANPTIAFAMSCGMSCTPELLLEPIAYQNQEFNVDESLTLSGFPQCAYIIDSFRAYLSQNAIGVGLNVATTGMMIASKGKTAMAMGMLGMTSQMNTIVQASQKPNIVKGSQGTSTFTALEEMDFFFVNKRISVEYARIIDEYFDMFGYATHRVKVPNITGRPSWNYVQTDDCKIVGSIPFDSLEKIKGYFNRGITFWHNERIGDYSQNNRP